MRSFITYTYSSPNIIRVIKSRRMKWEGHAAGIEEIKRAYRILNLKGINHLEEIDVVWTIIIKWI
jgi:hypothetical protein